MKALSGNGDLKFEHILMINVNRDDLFSDYNDLRNWCKENCQGLFMLTKCRDAVIGSPSRNNGITPFEDIKVPGNTISLEQNDYILVMFELQEDAVLCKTTYGN